MRTPATTASTHPSPSPQSSRRAQVRPIAAREASDRSGIGPRVGKFAVRTEGGASAGAARASPVESITPHSVASIGVTLCGRGAPQDYLRTPV
jgi:hypothetical protein